MKFTLYFSSLDIYNKYQQRICEFCVKHFMQEVRIELYEE